MYWLPPSRVKQSGKATTTGGMHRSPINRSRRSGRFSRKPTQFVWDRPLPAKPTRSTSSGNPAPSCPAGRYTSTTRADGSPSMLVLRAWLSMVIQLTEPIGPKNLRMRRPLSSVDIISGQWPDRPIQATWSPAASGSRRTIGCCRRLLGQGQELVSALLDRDATLIHRRLAGEQHHV
jgi:hypothetical protein